MNRISVISSNIKSVGHDATSDTLEVEFKTGALYQYAGVPSALFDGFTKAASKGKFFDEFIRNKFKTRRIQ